MPYRFTEADRGLIVTALRHLGGEAADALADRMVADSRKRRLAAAPTPAPEPFNPATGDPALDEWMREHHRDDWRERQRRAFTKTRPGMRTMPDINRPAGPKRYAFARPTLTERERVELWAEFNVRQTTIASSPDRLSA